MCAGALATTGPYEFVSYPQYVGFVLVITGFLVMWPTLVLFSILVWVYARLARREEAELRYRFGPAWDVYAQGTPRVLPRLAAKGPPQRRST